MASEPKPLLPLTDEAQATFDRWWDLYKQPIVEQIRENLRERTKVVLLTSVESVAQSVWSSFIEKHRHEIDPNSDFSAWKVLFEAAGPKFVRGLVPKHWDTANRTAAPDRKEGKTAKLESLKPQTADGDLQNVEIEDHREIPPAVAAECAEALIRLMHAPGGNLQDDCRTRYDKLIEVLDEEERFVFSLRLAGQSLREIAQHPEALQLGIDDTFAEEVWQRIQEKALEHGRKLPPTVD